MQCVTSRQTAAPLWPNLRESYRRPFKSEAIFGAFAKHWHLGLGMTIIASVALLPKGLIGLPGQWRDRLAGQLAGGRPVDGSTEGAAS